MGNKESKRQQPKRAERKSIQKFVPLPHGLSTEIIINAEDQRISVDRNNTYSFIGMIRAHLHRYRMPVIGTGFLIANDLVLTAAHNVYSQDQKIAQWFQFYPGQNGTIPNLSRQNLASNMPDKSCYYSIKKVEIPEVYLKQRSRNYDFCLIQLDRPVQNAQLASLLFDYKGKVEEYINCGYSNGQQNLCNYPQLKGTGKIQRYLQHHFEHLIDTEGGHSGSPIFLSVGEGSNEKCYCVGMHVAGTSKTSDRKFNLAIYLTEDLRNILMKMEEKMTRKLNRIQASTLPTDARLKLAIKDVNVETIATLQKQIDKINQNQDKNSQKLAQLYWECGSKAQQSKLYEKAASCFDNFIKISQNLQKDANFQYDYENAFFKLALNQTAQGKSIQNIKVYDRFIELFGKKYPPNSERMAFLNNNKGFDFVKLQRFHEASQLFQKAYQVRKVFFDEMNSLTISSLQNLAAMKLQLGEYELAAKYFDKVIEQKKARFGQKSQQWIWTKMNQAIVNFQMKNYSLSIKNFASSTQNLPKSQVNISEELQRVKIIENIQKYFRKLIFSDCKINDLREAHLIATKFGELSQIAKQLRSQWQEREQKQNDSVERAARS